MGYKDIGRKIQKAREEAGLNQEELAARIGLSQATLSNYELGKRRLYLAQLEAISRELGRPLQYFLLEGNDVECAPASVGSGRPNDISALTRCLTAEEKELVVSFINFIVWRRRQSDD